MSKELEAWDYVKNPFIKFSDKTKYFCTIETALKRLETLEEEKQSFDRQLEKKLKALEIIKKKCLKIDFKILLASTDYETYCFFTYCVKDGLTKEEYDLLRKVLL